MLKQCHRSLLAVLCGGAAALALAPAAKAVSSQALATTFSGDPTAVEIELTQSGGDIVVTVSVVQDHADLRAVYFNIEDDTLLPGISATGQDVTDFKIHTSNLGGNTSLVGNGSPCPCDIGVEIGVLGSGGPQGTGPDYIESTSFVLSHATLDLQIDQFMAQAVGVQVAGVGPRPCFDGAAKLAGVFAAQVPEPASGLLVAAGLGVIALARRARESLAL